MCRFHYIFPWFGKKTNQITHQPNCSDFSIVSSKSLFSLINVYKIGDTVFHDLFLFHLIYE